MSSSDSATSAAIAASVTADPPKSAAPAALTTSDGAEVATPAWIAERCAALDTADLPLVEHVEVYHRLHTELQAALAEIDGH